MVLWEIINGMASDAGVTDVANDFMNDRNHVLRVCAIGELVRPETWGLPAFEAFYCQSSA